MGKISGFTGRRLFWEVRDILVILIQFTQGGKIFETIIIYRIPLCVLSQRQSGAKYKIQSIIVLLKENYYR